MTASSKRPQIMDDRQAGEQDPLFLADSFRYLLAEHVLKHAKAMRKYLRRGGEEEVHEARTRSRKLLEAVLAASSFSPPLLCQPVMIDLRGLVSGLSSLRNQDISLAFLRRAARAVRQPEERDVMKKLLAAAERKRERLRRKAADEWSKDRVKKMLRKLRLLDEWTEARLSRVPSLLLADSFRRTRAARGRAFVQQLGRPSFDGAAALHPLRKSARELRYALEIQAGVMRDRSGRVLSLLKDWQRALGDHHDSGIRAKRLARAFARVTDKHGDLPRARKVFRALDGLNARHGRAAFARVRHLLRRTRPALLEKAFR